MSKHDTRVNVYCIIVRQELERHLSYRDILILRRESRGWRLKDMGDEPPAEKPPLDLEFMAGVEDSDPQVPCTEHPFLRANEK